MLTPRAIRLLFLATGIVWGSLLGVFAALVVGGAITGLFWIFVFGDNAWPDWTGVVITALTVLAGLFVFGSCVVASWKYALTITARQTGHAREYRRAIYLLVLAVAVIIGHTALEQWQTNRHAARSAARVEAERKRMELASPIRQPTEDDVSYYCRIVGKKSGRVSLDYRGTRLVIFQTLLFGDQVLFGIAGSYDMVQSIAKNARLLVGNNDPGLKLRALPESIRCGQTTYFVQSKSDIPSSYIESKIDLYIPEVAAATPMTVWKNK